MATALSGTILEVASGGILAVGGGWSSGTGWIVAVVAVIFLGLVARWATGRRRR